MNAVVPNYITQLWNTYRMPAHIRRHSIIVAHLAQYLAEGLQRAGETIDVDFARDGGLIHDIGKIVALHEEREPEHHQIGYEILIKEGYDDLAHVARAHMLEKLISHDKKFTRIEEKIVNYSDKCVAHDTVVSLEERLDCLKKRYPGIDKLIDEVYPEYKEFQTMLFNKIGITQLPYETLNIYKK